MAPEEFEMCLKLMGGLENGVLRDKPRITSRHYFTVGDGWLHLIINLIEELIAAGWDREVVQVKEKFGGLRFYTNSAPEGGYDIINKYEALSQETCEICGEKGKLRDTGWMRTLCDEHATP